jgi:aspartate dehydrogenase
MENRKIRVGIVGFGNLGKFLFEKIIGEEKLRERFEIAFVWNRTVERVREDKRITEDQILESLSDFQTKNPTLIVEVSHPKIIAEFGTAFLQYADLFVGSPTAFADESIEQNLRKIAKEGRHGCYIPSGALWGAEDIQKMADVGSLKGLTISMKKHPSSMKLEPPLCDAVNEYINSPNEKEQVIYEGPVGKLCPLAPNNVNTMACAALAGHTLGFSNVKARLLAEKNLEAHVIEIEVLGPGDFSVRTVRYNPAKIGAVTGNATYASFLGSLLRVGSRGNGIHFV